MNTRALNWLQLLRPSSSYFLKSSRILCVPTQNKHLLIKNNYNEDNGYKNARSNIYKLASLVTLGIGLGYYTHNKFKSSLVIHAATPSDNAQDDMIFGRKNHNFIAQVVKKCAPSVVYIEITDSRFNRVVTNGSGFIISSDGLILTNAHVVAKPGHTRLNIRLQNGKSYVGNIIDTNHTSDMAVIKINASDLPAVKLGNSSELEAGEWVVAIGSPLALSNTVTAGVVSSVNRKGSELGLDKGIDYIQTDATITFGNSGGPLVNLDGEVIGINTMKITAGISFAIPINYAKHYVQQLNSKLKNRKSSTEIKRKYMGLTLATLTPQVALALQQRNVITNDVNIGVLILKVVNGSPAQYGGLRSGDIITHINGSSINGVQQIYDILENPKCSNLEVSIIRGRERFIFNVLPED